MLTTPVGDTYKDGWLEGTKNESDSNEYENNSTYTSGSTVDIGSGPIAPVFRHDKKYEGN